MKEETIHLYEEALKRESELEGVLMAEIDSIGKPELWDIVKNYATAFAVRIAIEASKNC
jgi:hypothetical protein|nr:MAG TPA: hypothetical protein [Caudoviricetes sp.]DAT42911.1 MAG TPA: hypothetical protein [Caudoviricetes sp.]